MLQGLLTYQWKQSGFDLKVNQSLSYTIIRPSISSTPCRNLVPTRRYHLEIYIKCTQKLNNQSQSTNQGQISGTRCKGFNDYD